MISCSGIFVFHSADSMEPRGEKEKQRTEEYAHGLRWSFLKKNDRKSYNPLNRAPLQRNSAQRRRPVPLSHVSRIMTGSQSLGYGVRIDSRTFVPSRHRSGFRGRQPLRGASTHAVTQVFPTYYLTREMHLCFQKRSWRDQILLIHLFH